jgi:hypothetical protein
MYYRATIAGFLLLFASVGQTETVAGSAPTAALTAPAPIADPSPKPLLLRQDTPVELMAVKEVSTADAIAGTRFKVRVNKAVMAESKLVIPVGSWAYGEVTDAIDSGGLGKSGRMTARLLYVQMGDAQIPLSGDISARGTGAGSAGVAILFTGWAGFFHRGNNAKIKAGEILTGFIAEDAWLDVSGAAVRRVPAPVTPSAAGPQLTASHISPQ